MPGGRRRGAGRSVPHSAPTSSPWRASAGEASSATPRSSCLDTERSLLDAAGRLRQGGRGVARSSGTWCRRSTTSALLSDEQAQMVERLTALGGGRRGRGGQGRHRQDLGPRRRPDVVGVERTRGARHLPSLLGRPGACATGPASTRGPWPRCWPASSRAAPSSAPSDVVVLDEAGMVGTRALARLVEGRRRRRCQGGPGR